MNPLSILKLGAATLLVFGAYFFGLSQGHDSEQLKHAQAQVIQLTETIKRYETKQREQTLAMADIRVSESRARDEYEWMRQQLAILESRTSKNNASGDCLRFQRLAVEKEQLLNEAQRGLEFCYKNHR